MGHNLLVTTGSEFLCTGICDIHTQVFVSHPYTRSANNSYPVTNYLQLHLES